MMYIYTIKPGLIFSANFTKSKQEQQAGAQWYGTWGEWLRSAHSGIKPLLVGGFNPSEKYESQLGWLFPRYGKMKLMFQTINQIIYSTIIPCIPSGKPT